MAWKTQLSKTSFACIEDENSPIAILGIPLDHTNTYRPGTRYAPQRIRETACNLELYSLLAEITLEDIGFRDYGDLSLPPGDVSRSIDIIKSIVRNVINEHRGLVVFLGGEHLLTYPVIQVLREKIDTLVVFDAHLDMREEYMGSRLNHATFLRYIVEEGVKTIHIGSRAYSKGELEFTESREITVINTLETPRGVDRLGDLGRIYISIDMDVFDPSIAPGVSNPEPLGLSHMVFVSILNQLLSKSSGIVGVDVVEVNPLVDHSDITSLLAAKLVIEITGIYLRNHVYGSI